MLTDRPTTTIWCSTTSAGPAGSPRVLLLHGLEGSAHSLHTQGLAVLVAAARLALHGAQLSFVRARSGTNQAALSNRRAAPLSLGRHRRSRLRRCGPWPRESRTSRSTRSASRWAGTSCSSGWARVGAASAIRAAATMSVPYDLAAASRFLERPGGALLRLSLPAAAQAEGARRAGAVPARDRAPRRRAHRRGARPSPSSTQCVTAPLHGFASAEDYYRRSSAHRATCRALRVPTLCISSRGRSVLSRASGWRGRARPARQTVAFEVTPWGGHTGFVAGPWPWRPRYWAEERGDRLAARARRPADEHSAALLQNCHWTVTV